MAQRWMERLELEAAGAARNAAVMGQVASEAALIDAAITGEHQAFATLYDRYLERVYRHIYYRTGNRADAEDLTQQCFLQAWRALSRYRRTQAPFVAWLLTIAHNLIVSFYRKAKHELHLDPIPVPDRDRWTDPEAQVLAEHDRLAVRRAILVLNADQQQVITMRFIDHLEFAEIAAAIGKSEGNVRVIQHRALQRLRQVLSVEGGG